MNRAATEQEADAAVARLMPMIEAANASNQNGEDAVVKAIKGFDHFDRLVSALQESQRALAMLISPEAISGSSIISAFASVMAAEATARNTLAKVGVQ